MSINDPLILKFDVKRQKYWWQRGSETFYQPETREWLQWADIHDALDWAERNEPDSGIGFSLDIFQTMPTEGQISSSPQGGMRGRIMGLLRDQCQGDQGRRQLFAYLFDYPHVEMSGKLVSDDQWVVLDAWIGLQEDGEIEGYWWCRKGLPKEIATIMKSIRSKQK